MKLYKKHLGIAALLVSLNIFFFVALPVLAQSVAAPQTTEQRCSAFQKQFSLTSGVSIIGGSKVFCSATELILAIINLALTFSGVITILFLIIGGFLFITSAGNEEQAEKGRKILTNSIIGLAIIIMSGAIVRIIASTLTLTK